SGTPGNGDVGNLTIRVTATDGSRAAVSTTFSLTISNVNDAPVVTGSLPPQRVSQDGSFNFTVPAGTFTDPDGDTLTLSATQADGAALPAWLNFTPATGTFSGTPGSTDSGSLVIRITATDAENTSISTTFSLTVARAGTPGGDPQFRISDGMNAPRPLDSRALTLQPQGPGVPPLAPASLGSFSAGRSAGSSSMMASIFDALRDGASEDAAKSDVANVFGRSASFGSQFESTLGAFPSFNKDPALGGTSSLASVFSSIYLPALTPMEVFTGGSWKDINLQAQGVSEPGQEPATAAFTPSFHQQLQQIGEAEGQRLAIIEQALYDHGQQQNS
ncbi:putative Ig domain-containing protein, partial [Pantoea sp.]|uniref:putative Ig domain-containing protein n=1 Tax=Pantoea sp. TaxID=69393 RepID=UPI0031DB3C24